MFFFRVWAIQTCTNLFRHYSLLAAIKGPAWSQAKARNLTEKIISIDRTHGIG